MHADLNIFSNMMKTIEIDLAMENNTYEKMYSANSVNSKWRKGNRDKVNAYAKHCRKVLTEVYFASCVHSFVEYMCDALYVNVHFV